MTTKETTAPTLPEKAPNAYVGIFTDAKIQASINKVRARLADGQSGLVLHVDDRGEYSLSVVQRLGSHVSVEALVAYDGAGPWTTFDRNKLKLQAELIAKW